MSSFFGQSPLLIEKPGIDNFILDDPRWTTP